MKLGADVHHVSLHCWKGSQSQRSRSQQGQMHFSDRG